MVCDGLNLMPQISGVSAVVEEVSNPPGLLSIGFSDAPTGWLTSSLVLSP